MGVDEKLDLPEAFHEHRTREFAGGSGGTPFPRKKIEFGIGGDAISYCIGGLYLDYLHSSVSSSSILYHVLNPPPQPYTPPRPISMQI